MAIAPPSMLTLSLSNPSSEMTARLCEENASFNSNRSTESNSQPTLSSTFLVASTGPMPITSGGHPLTAPPQMVAITSSPLSAANFSLHTIMATAPSVSGEDVAAVTVPFSENTGLSAAMASRVESDLMQPSEVTMSSRSTTGMISSSNAPASSAALALKWESSANASWSARLTPQSSAMFSAVCPMVT